MYETVTILFIGITVIYFGVLGLKFYGLKKLNQPYKYTLIFNYRNKV